jgi:hypothetical protein
VLQLRVVVVTAHSRSVSPTCRPGRTIVGLARQASSVWEAS